MTDYEILYILSPKLEDAAREELIERFKKVVESAGGNAEVVKWGVRKLAYNINFMSEGFYVLMNFTASEDVPAELERQMRITDAVMRFIVTKKIENKLTREEAFAIRYHMGFSGSEDERNVGKAFGMFPLAVALSIADTEATFFMEKQPPSMS